MRPATACHACRLSKRKCRPPTEGAPKACARCHRQQIACSFVTLPTYGQNVSPTHAPLSQGSRTEGGTHVVTPSTSPPAWPDDVEAGLAQEMIGHYFSVVHDTHHSLFHRPTLEVDLVAGKAADVVLYAILSLGSRFVSSSNISQARLRRLGEEYAEKAHRSLDIRDVSITTVQGCILLGTLCYADGQGAAEAVYYATAARLAIILDLPRRSSATEIERQTNLRVWWTLYMIDIWSSSGLQLSRQLSYQTEIELPVDELEFLNLKSDVPHMRRPASTAGIWGEMARLSYLWCLVQDINKTSVEQNLSPMAQTSEVEDLAGKLHDWHEALPPFLQETPENLRSMATRGLGTTFAALHLGYHYYHEVLFYQFMAESHQTPSPLANRYASECASHARAFCDLLYLCEQTEGCKCLYAMVGHMLVVTSTVYMHMLLFNAPIPLSHSPKSNEASSGNFPGSLRSRLEHNFQILTGLQTHWGTLDVSLARLSVFHNACLYSMEHSFKMDRWMSRFIFGHGTSMPEKFEALEGGNGGDDEHLKEWYPNGGR